MRCCLHNGGGCLGRVFCLEDAGADEDTIGTEPHGERRVGRCRNAARNEVHHWKATRLDGQLDEFIGNAHLFGGGAQALLALPLECGDLFGDGANVAHRLNDVAGSRFTLGAHHCGTLVDAAQRLTEILAATNEGHLVVMLVDVEAIIGGGKHF